MKTERNILAAFLLNLAFSLFEFVGGILTGSVAILSDAVHDIGDASSIGISFFLEKKSKQKPDAKYTYGYMRFSVVGSVLTTLILLFGSAAVIYNAVTRIITPSQIHYDGMILFAVVGVIVNLGAALLTREGEGGSLNQRAVNLHMLEDVLGWIVVLVGAVVMRFTDFSLLDPIMSIGVAVFILVSAIKNLGESLSIFLEKTPVHIDVDALSRHLCELQGVVSIHHIHIWSLDGENNALTMHAVIDGEAASAKAAIREELLRHGICHATIETDAVGEQCAAEHCHIESDHSAHHHHHPRAYADHQRQTLERKRKEEKVKQKEPKGSLV